MLNDFTKMIQEESVIIPKALIYSFKDLNITEKELVLILLLLSYRDNQIVYNPKKISNDLKESKMEIIKELESLNQKQLIKTISEKGKDDVISLKPLYQKVDELYTSNKKEDQKNLFQIFEKEIGRPLSPMEYSIINDWIDDKVNEEVILGALKEAIFNGVTSLKYIDKIIYEWKKKGIDSVDKIKKHQNLRTKTETIEIPDYNWLEE